MHNGHNQTASHPFHAKPTASMTYAKNFGINAY